jgi:hypothetical protein
MSDPSDLTTRVAEHSALSATLVAGYLGYLPPFLNILGAIAALIWFIICIKESRTFVTWARNRQAKWNVRHLAKLRAREKIVVARIEAAEKLRQARVAARELIDHEIAEAAKLVAQADIASQASAVVRNEKESAALNEVKLP